MHLEVGKKYRTYAGDTIEVLGLCESQLMESDTVIGVWTYASSGKSVAFERRTAWLVNDQKDIKHMHSIKEEIKRKKKEKRKYGRKR